MAVSGVRRMDLSIGATVRGLAATRTEGSYNILSHGYGDPGEHHQKARLDVTKTAPAAT
jgi:hypothetical protein